MDLSFSYGDSELRGNGALPVQLLEQDRETIFTAPDITENDLKMVILEGSHWFEDSIQLSANAFYRDIDTDSFNGDGTELDECAGTSAETAGLAEPEEFRCENAGGDNEERVQALFARIENIFDTDYETFGLLGEPAAVLGPAFDDPRFLSPGAERGGWVGVRLSL